MTIQATGGKLHWNYFLALEHDMEVVSRYVEFADGNFNTYSIELAHLLFAAASEVDVIAKLLCGQVSPTSRAENIDQYRAILIPAIPDLPATTVFVPRYGLKFAPWDNWGDNTNPDWWRAYNQVKHRRDEQFAQATLKNALNALGGLLVLTFHLYARILAPKPTQLLTPKDTNRQLVPESSLFRLNDDWYYHVRIA